MLALILAVLMMLSMAACGGDQTPTEDTKAPEAPVETTGAAEPETTEATEPKTFEPQTMTSGDFEITVLGAEAIKGREDVPAIRVYYQFTNNASYTVKAVDDLSFKVTQNGEAIDAVIPKPDIPEDANKELYIRPGATIRCTTVRKLLDETTPVVFAIGSFYTKEYLEVELDLAALPGAPAEPLQITPVADPQSMAGLATEGTMDEKYAVAITGVERTTDRSGNDAIVVHMSYTNNSDKAARFSSAVKAKAFQDGIQLQVAVPEDLQDPAYKMRTTDCEPGQTVAVDVYYELISTSPCEVEVCDSHISNDTDEYFEERIGMIFTVE